jgi:hypothetical protein
MAAAAAVAAAAEVRAAVTEEIVLSEQRYYGRLLKLESQFYRPLGSALTAREHASIFGCLESIVGVRRAGVHDDRAAHGGGGLGGDGGAALPAHVLRLHLEL